jgi:hypothetical protein
LGAQQIADAGDGFDREPAEGACEVPDARDHALDCIFADDPPVPAALDQLVAADDAPVSLCKHDEHHHHAGLDRVAAPGARGGEPRGFEPDVAEGEGRFISEENAPAVGELLQHDRASLSRGV